MSEETQRIALSKKGQRKVTPFTGNELLFDYLTGVLDEERRKAVAAHLENSKEAQIDLQKIQNGLNYTEKMKSITVSKALQETLNAPSSYLSVLFSKARFDQWPVGLKWGLEALVVVFVIVTVLSVAPWEKVLKLRLSSSNEVVLTELNKTTVAQNGPTEDIPKTAETPQFVDEDLKPKEPTLAASKTAVPAASVTPTATTPAIAGGKPTTIAATKAPVPVAATEVKPTAVAAVAAVPTKAVADASAEEDSETPTTSATPKPTGGFLYRGTLAVTNLEAVGPKIVEKITQIGGRKAGEVELGWQKNEGSAYFHFTIPEAKYDELKEFLSGYGKPRLNLEKHPRVMPDGIIRLIITVDEAKK